MAITHGWVGKCSKRNSDDSITGWLLDATENLKRLGNGPGLISADSAESPTCGDLLYPHFIAVALGPCASWRRRDGPAGGDLGTWHGVAVVMGPQSLDTEQPLFSPYMEVRTWVLLGDIILSTHRSEDATSLGAFFCPHTGVRMRAS